MTAAAERQRRHRARRRAGMAVFRVEAAQFDLADALVSAGWLSEWDSDDPARIEQALNRAIVHLIEGDA